MLFMRFIYISACPKKIIAFLVKISLLSSVGSNFLKYLFKLLAFFTQPSLLILLLFQKYNSFDTATVT
jgi:hypothetical protein